MKKILLILISVLFLSSCASHKRTGNKQHKKTHKKTERRNVKKEPKTDLHKKEELSELGRKKEVLTPKILANLYVGKTNLSSKKINYIKKYSELAVNEMQEYKIPASITLAQGLLESRYGESVLTKSAKNHFGIKCHKWTGAKIYHDDDEKGECFRKYKHDETSYRDHSLFLSGKKRYEKLFSFAPNDYKSWARGLQKAGYATDKKYPEKLILLIEEYELYKFDTYVLGNSYQDITKKNSQNNKEAIRNDHSKIHIVSPGETLYGIAKSNNLTTEAIKRFNNLNSNTISVGQQLKMYESKHNTALPTEKNMKKQTINYIVKKGDTIYSIAKKNNISAYTLKDSNQLKDDQLKIGQKLIIRLIN